MSEDANYYDRFANHNDNQTPETKKAKKVKVIETGYSLAKIFGYMFIGLLITSVVALGLGYLVSYLMSISPDAETSEMIMIGVVAVLIVSAIALIVMSFVVPIVAIRNKHSVLVPAIIYTIVMGVMLSTITAFIPWYILGLTFGITSVIFGLMALIAILSKSRLNGLAIVAMGLFAGAGLLALSMWILMLTGVMTGEMVWLYWVIVLVTFAAMMFITIWDIARIKKIAQEGEMNQNLSLYCAFILYNDFISILLRVLRIVLMIMGKSKN